MVETKRVQPPYTTFIFVGKVIVPQYHAATYWLGFKLEGSPVATSVKKPFFDSVVVGSNIKVDYGFGRLSHEYEPTRITLVDN